MVEDANRPRSLDLRSNKRSLEYTPPIVMAQRCRTRALLLIRHPPYGSRSALRRSSVSVIEERYDMRSRPSKVSDDPVLSRVFGKTDRFRSPARVSAQPRMPRTDVSDRIWPGSTPSAPCAMRFSRCHLAVVCAGRRRSGSRPTRQAVLSLTGVQLDNIGSRRRGCTSARTRRRAPLLRHRSAVRLLPRGHPAPREILFAVCPTTPELLPSPHYIAEHLPTALGLRPWITTPS